MESILAIPFSNILEGDYVIIEQEPWAKDVGRTSKNQGIMAIGSMIFGGALPDPNCGGLAEFDTSVYVYPSRHELAYSFNVSHGSFIPKSVNPHLLREEVIQCGYNLSAETDYPVIALQSMMWIGECYDAKGVSVTRPTISVNGRTLLFSTKVYGSVRIKYFVYRREYSVNIKEREDSIENNFECVAFCRWNGGITYKDIVAPNGFDDTLGNCGNGIYPEFGDDGSSTKICQPNWGRGTYPVGVKADKLTEVDFCSQEIMSVRITESVESGNEEGDECSDGPITTN